MPTHLTYVQYVYIGPRVSSLLKKLGCNAGTLMLQERSLGCDAGTLMLQER